jgi:hypothetical protein
MVDLNLIKNGAWAPFLLRPVFTGLDVWQA